MLRRVCVLFAVSIALVLSCEGCGQNEAPAPQVSKPESVRFTATDYVPLAGVWRGVSGSQDVVLLVSTVGYTDSTWQNTAAYLGAAGWTTFAIDLRDSALQAGKTWIGSPRDSAAAIDRYVKDIIGGVNYARQRAGAKAKIILVGADIAGVSALYAATAESRVVAVALVSPPEGLSNLIAGGLITRYGDRPLMVMTELPISGTIGTPRTTDSWLGRGSAITMRLTAPQQTTLLDDRNAALSKLANWISNVAM